MKKLSSDICIELIEESLQGIFDISFIENVGAKNCKYKLPKFREIWEYIKDN